MALKFDEFAIVFMSISAQIETYMFYQHRWIVEPKLNACMKTKALAREIALSKFATSTVSVTNICVLP